MVTLRSRTIRLAFANPALRPHLLPLLHVGGLLEPPPAMVDAITDWVMPLTTELKKPVEKAFPVDTKGWKLWERSRFKPEAVRGMSQIVVRVYPDPPAGKHYRGSWDRQDKVMNLHLTPHLRANPKELHQVVTHELRHFAQDYINLALGNPDAWLHRDEHGGMPSRSIRTPNFAPGRAPPAVDARRKMRERGESSRNLDYHGLMDVEFYTDLADRVFDFNQHLSRTALPPEHVNMAVREYVGLLPAKDAAKVYGRELAFTFRPSKFFDTLKRAAPDKYRKAVKEFVKMVQP